jgi:hypothetical protein
MSVSHWTGPSWRKVEEQALSSSLRCNNIIFKRRGINLILLIKRRRRHGCQARSIQKVELPRETLTGISTVGQGCAAGAPSRVRRLNRIEIQSPKSHCGQVQVFAATTSQFLARMNEASLSIKSESTSPSTPFEQLS